MGEQSVRKHGERSRTSLVQTRTAERGGKAKRSPFTVAGGVGGLSWVNIRLRYILL